MVLSKRMSRKELVDLFTTSDTVRQFLSVFPGVNNPEKVPLSRSETIYHFSGLPYSDILAFLRSIDPNLSIRDEYEVRRIENGHAHKRPGDYLALRKAGCILIKKEDIAQMRRPLE